MLKFAGVNLEILLALEGNSDSKLQALLDFFGDGKTISDRISLNHSVCPSCFWINKCQSSIQLVQKNLSWSKEFPHFLPVWPEKTRGDPWIPQRIQWRESHHQRFLVLQSTCRSDWKLGLMASMQALVWRSTWYILIPQYVCAIESRHLWRSKSEKCNEKTKESMCPRSQIACCPRFAAQLREEAVAVDVKVTLGTKVC